MESTFRLSHHLTADHYIITTNVFFSMILMAICDAGNTFSLVDIGSFGSNNDIGVFHNSPIEEAFFNDETSLSVAECLEDAPTFGKVPYFLVSGLPFAVLVA